MRVVLFYHSLVSDWNHGNAHFLRGIAAELIDRGHDVVVYEPVAGWSRQQLLAEAGTPAIDRFHQAFPTLRSRAVDLDRLSIDAALDRADLVIVHEWNPHALVAAIGRHHARNARYVLLFHDTHHRSVSAVDEMARYDLEHYDGVLAFGEVIRERYLSFGWARRAWTWHEAADTRTFRKLAPDGPVGDLVWIGNWGDEERSEEIRSYLVAPSQALQLSTTIHGVGYPDAAKQELAAAGIHYAGWIANYDAPRAYARHRMTVHIPRRPYMETLPGIPTIRMFEALACGMPLVSLGWKDLEGLFTAGEDYLVADTPARMQHHLATLQADGDLRRSLSTHGIRTIAARHTCAHRVDELLAIFDHVREIPHEVTSA